MHKICFTISLFHASTCFEDHVLIVRRSKLYYTASGIITLIDGRPVHMVERVLSWVLSQPVHGTATYYYYYYYYYYICTNYSGFTRITKSWISVKIRPFWTKDLQFCWRQWRQTWVTLGSPETRVAISEVWAMFINFCSSFHSSNLAAKNVFHQRYMAVQVAGYECSSEALHTLQSSSRAKGVGGVAHFQVFLNLI